MQEKAVNLQSYAALLNRARNIVADTDDQLKKLLARNEYGYNVFGGKLFLLELESLRSETMSKGILDEDKLEDCVARLVLLRDIVGATIASIDSGYAEGLRQALAEVKLLEAKFAEKDAKLAKEQVMSSEWRENWTR